MTDTNQPVNPYQPPPIIERESPSVFAFADINLDLDDKTPVPFAGAPEISDLKQFLKTYDTVGALPLTIGILFAVLLQFSSLMVSVALGMVVAGGVFIAALTLITSTRWYRASVFLSMYPRWQEAAAGELTADGIQINRSTESAFYRWSWFSGVVISDRMVGFVPAEESEMPILVAAQMLPESITFSRLKDFARSAKVVCENAMTDEGIGWANRQVMQEPSRQRSSRPPADAIPLQGSVTGDDLKEFSERLSVLARPVRGRVIRILLLSAVSVSGLGCLIILAQIEHMRGLILLLISVGMLAMLILLKMRRRSELMSRDHLLYYLIGYASEAGITTDFFVVVTTVPWTNLIVQHESADRVLLRKKTSRKLLMLRSDMFSSPSDWQQFLEMTRSKATRQAKRHEDRERAVLATSPSGSPRRNDDF